MIEFLISHSDRLVVRIRREVGCRQSAEDVVAEALVAAWRRRDELPEVGERLLGWFHRTARNLARNHVRGEIRRRNLLNRAADHVTIGPSEGMYGHDVIDRIVMRDAWAHLSELDRDVLALAVAGLSYAEIAEVVGLGLSGVGMRIKRARERLLGHVDLH